MIPALWRANNLISEILQGTVKWVENTLRWMRGQILLRCCKGLKMTFATHHIGGILSRDKLTVSYKNGEAEDVNSGDLFYWPPGHTVNVGKHAEIILFSPQHEHTQVLDHINNKLGA